MEKKLLCDKIIKNCIRKFSTTSLNNGKRNFKNMALYNFRGSYNFKKRQQENPDPDIPVYTYGVREPGYVKNKKFVLVPEMVPELIVPDLTNFPLKPYVSYRASDVYQSEFTAKDLFDAVYSEKITRDFQDKKLDENGNSSEPNSYEKLTPEEATMLARKTGTDLY